MNIPQEDEKPDSEEVYRVKFHYTEIGTYPVRAKCEEEAQEKLYDLLQEKGLYPLYTACDITEVFFNVHNVEEVE